MTARRINATGPAQALGPMLSNAASYAAYGQRLLIASVICADVAADFEDLGELLEAGEPQEWFALLADVGSFAEELQRIADAYGHREARRIARRGLGT